MSQQEGLFEDLPGGRGASGQPSAESAAEEGLPKILECNTAVSAFEYVLSQPWRKPRKEDEPKPETKNLGFRTPRRLHGLMEEVLHLQELTKTRALVAYVRIHVTLSEMFGSEGAAGRVGPFDEPELSSSAPLREVYRYATQDIERSVGADDPMIGVQVPIDLVRDFKSWTARQEVTMSSVMLRYILFHVSQHRRRFGLSSGNEE